MKEICREKTERSSTKMSIAYFVLLAICCNWAYESYRFNATGELSVVGMGLSVLWLCLWIWKVFFRYEYILRETELEIVTIGFWRQGSYVIDLTKTESFAQKYRHDFFRRTRIGKYVHRWSMVDEHPTRIIAFTKGKGLVGVIFCCSDNFLKEMIRLMPDKYIGM